MEKFLFWWEHGQYRLVCYKGQSMCGNAELWRTTDFGINGKYSSQQAVSNSIPHRYLRDVITTAKRVMIKVKIDRQKTGQSSTTPFMWVTDCSQSSDRTSKRGVTFDAMETLERHSDSIDKLTLLVSEMNVKMDKKETPYKPRVYQGRPRGQSRNRQQTFHPLNRSFRRNRNRNRGNYNNRNNNRSSYRDRSRDNYRHGNMRNNYQSNERRNNNRQDNRRRDSYKQDNGNRHNYRGNDSQQRYRDMSEGIEIDQGIIVVTILEVETEIGIDGCNKELELCQMTEKDLGPGPIQE